MTPSWIRSFCISPVVCHLLMYSSTFQDIKALFPPDYNPFYAGFGNRDTDELSYRKIGIPKGKIFIINPKVWTLSFALLLKNFMYSLSSFTLLSNMLKLDLQGEVAINHQIDVKSYTSLHTLVNDMFPPTSMVEQVSARWLSFLVSHLCLF